MTVPRPVKAHAQGVVMGNYRPPGVAEYIFLDPLGHGKVHRLREVRNFISEASEEPALDRSKLHRSADCSLIDGGCGLAVDLGGQSGHRLVRVHRAWYEIKTSAP